MSDGDCLRKRTNRTFAAWFAAAVFAVAPGGVALAQISPGKLSAAHAEFEGIKNCTRCHELREEVQPGNCLACHTAVGARIDRDEGYHATGEVREKNCAECHSEHHGRDYDLIYWPDGRDAFEHALAGWRLTGAHARLDCRTCHKPGFQVDGAFAGDETVDRKRTYLGLDRRCLTCHADEHLAQLTDNCADCHNSSAWSPAPGFDHDADSDYPLTGKHAELLCDKCHEPVAAPAPADPDLLVFAGSPVSYTRYSDIAHGSCDACHRDPHAGRFEKACAECHTTAGFREVETAGFDHERTDYPLRGLHQPVACAKCHTSGVMTEPLAHNRCRDCHADEHRGQFAERADGGACDACHGVQRPFARHTYTAADHRNSDYPLTGSHRAVPCARCHEPVETEGREQYARFRFDDTRCRACHEDVHRGQLDVWIEKSGCDYCHSTDSWHRTNFDHSLARFALEGKHREIECLRCHFVETDEGGRELWMKPLERTCAGCHDDVHAGQFLAAGARETACERCHTAEGWQRLVFNHDRDTEFALAGGHENVACGECHRRVVVNGVETVQYAGVPRACSACHGSRRTGN